MRKFLIVLSSIFEFIFYTFFMVLIDSIPFTSSLFRFFVHFLALIVVAIVFYFLICFIFRKLEMRGKKYLYYVAIWNIILGVFAPVLLIIIIPSEFLTTVSFLILVGTIYYGIFINFIFCLCNHFLTNRKKNMG